MGEVLHSEEGVSERFDAICYPYLGLNRTCHASEGRAKTTFDAVRLTHLGQIDNPFSLDDRDLPGRANT